MGDVEMAAAGYSLNHAAQNFGYSLSVEEDARRQAQLMKKKEKMVIAIAAFTFLISFINIIIAENAEQREKKGMHISLTECLSKAYW